MHFILSSLNCNRQGSSLPSFPSFFLVIYFSRKRNDCNHYWVSGNRLILYVDFSAGNLRNFLIFFSCRKHQDPQWIYTLDYRSLELLHGPVRIHAPLSLWFFREEAKWRSSVVVYQHSLILPPSSSSPSPSSYSSSSFTNVWLKLA